jgi:eukaryotic-like serine/threonine-protein kinase
MDRSPSSATAKAPSDADDATVAVEAPAHERETPIGTAIGRYLVLDTLGTGGMGRVLRAYDPKLHREVALKQLRSRALGPDAQTRLVLEAQALAQLSHPNVVAVYDVDATSNEVIVTMELVRGMTLHAWLRDPRPWRDCVKVLIQAGRGLAAAHAANLVHRDFKPANVMITEAGQAKVMDFGLAKPTATEESSDVDLARERAQAHLRASQVLGAPSVVMTQADQVMGTPAYMAPEQHEGFAVEATADQYAFCVTLWQALTGARPFLGEVVEIALAKRRGPPPWPRAVVVPRRLSEALRRGLSPLPRDRWPSMNALLDALAGALRPARSLRWVMAGTLVFGAGAVSVSVLQGGVAAQCEGGREHLVGVWDDEIRATVAARLEEVGADLAHDAEARISDGLDAYAEAWVEGHGQACEATTVRGEQSSAILDARMACLHRAQSELEATTRLLRELDERTVVRALELVEELPHLERCADVDALLAEAPPPEDPTVRAAVEEARERLAEAKLLHRIGRYDEALVAVQLIHRDAEPLAHPPLTAEVTALEGEVLEALGRFEPAEAALRRAAWLAIEHGLIPLSVTIGSTWSFVLDVRLSRPEEAQLVAQLVLQLARRIRERAPSLEAVAIARIASLHEGRGQWAQAEASYREALALIEGAAVVDELELATVLNDLGILHEDRRQAAEAAALHRRALEIRERLLGVEHPYVGSVLTNLGNDLYLLGERDEATRSYERALSIYERAYGPEHPLTTTVRGNLGALALAAGELERATAIFEQMARLRVQQYGPSHPEVASVYNNLAAAEQRRGRLEPAREHLQRALEIWTQTLGPDHPQVGMAHGNLGLVERGLGHRVAAIEHFEEELRLSVEARPERLAGTKLELAQLLWEDPSTRARARTLAEESAVGYRQAEALDDQAVADAWLREHPLAAP